MRFGFTKAPFNFQSLVKKRDSILDTNVSFGKQEVEYLSHVFSKGGVKVDHEKIQDIKKWNIPYKSRFLEDFWDL